MTKPNTGLADAQRSVHIFLPVFFDAASFRLLRENIIKILPSQFTAHFHLLDDSAGEDPSIQEIRFPDVSVIQMPFNLGHQKALVYGLRQFLGENRDYAIIVSMDSDGEDRPEDLPALLDVYLKNESLRPIVLAKRTRRNESFIFKTFYLIYKNIFHALTGTVIQTGNYAVLHSAAIAKIIYHPYFDLAYASTLFSLGSQLRFLPCPRGQRYEGRSRMNFLRLAIHGISMLMPFMDKIAVRGVLAFSALLFLSFFTSASLAAAHVLGIVPIPRWPLILSSLVFVLSFFAICSFAVLITVFVNVQGLAMARLQQWNGKLEK